MRRYIIVILLLCLALNLSASPQQQKKKKTISVEAVSSGKHKSMVYLDISSKRVEYRNLKANIDKKLRAGSDTLFLTVFSNTGAAVKCATFDDLATKDNVFVRSASLTSKQLSDIVSNSERTKIVVVVNLFNNNTNFKLESGHSLFSSEGMRFLDGYMKCVFYENNIPVCRINTNCSSKEQSMFIDPLIKKMNATGVNVILNKF